MPVCLEGKLMPESVALPEFLWCWIPPHGHCGDFWVSSPCPIAQRNMVLCTIAQVAHNLQVAKWFFTDSTAEAQILRPMGESFVIFNVFVIRVPRYLQNHLNGPFGQLQEPSVWAVAGRQFFFQRSTCMESWRARLPQIVPAPSEIDEAVVGGFQDTSSAYMSGQLRGHLLCIYFTGLGAI